MKYILLMTTAMTLTIAAAATVSAWPKEAIPGVNSQANMQTNRRVVEEVKDPRIAAERFVEHVNYARVALAMKNTPRAEEEIAHARQMMSVLKSSSGNTKLTRVESSRLSYDYNAAHKYHYFPIETGPVEVKKVRSGPFWARRGLAVTDAEIVYLTVDVSGTKPEQRLNDAENAIKIGNLQEADNQLAELTDEVVATSEQASIPVDKARDNIGLARSFIAEQNYEGARYALKHADAALDQMERDANYKDRRATIASMRKEVNRMESDVAKNNPSLLDKADAKLEKWWNDLKDWTSNSHQAAISPAR